MTITAWKQPEIEEHLRQTCSLDVPWVAVQKLSTLVRLSGNDEEQEAVDFIATQLDAFGVAYELHTPTLFVSWPLEATLRIVGDTPMEVRAKTSSMSVSTDGQELEGELVYLPTSYARDMNDIFMSGSVGDIDIRGKVVVTEGMVTPAKVADVAPRGAVAAVFVAPGERIHEGICTTIWGSPDLDSMNRQPTIPVLAVNHADGLKLIERAKTAPCHVAFSTTVDTTWRPIPVLVAEIRGSAIPEEFVLVHGHLDSWHHGVGDNAVGDATLLELARVFRRHSSELRRSVRIAWWSGHSHGRYAGSTWYADTYAIDLAENCVAQVNCDSPGCRWATVYNDIMWTEEAGPMAAGAIRDVTGEETEGTRPLRAGDYSFSNLGISSFFMLSSTMPEHLRREKGYYAVGGCGGNIAWHAEDDTLEIADRDNLLRDIRLYATAVWRTANAPVPPFDFRLTLDQFVQTLNGYQQQAGDRFDFAPATQEIAALRADLDRFYGSVEHVMHGEPTDAYVHQAGLIQRRLGRLLIPVNYARSGRFQQDPAEYVPALPDLALVTRLAKAVPGSHEDRAATVSLQRGLNRLVWVLRRSREVVVGLSALEE